MASVLLVLLQVLKIIGFVLLGILAFVLFLILLICLVPVRYKGNVKYIDKANGFFKISWLCSAVYAKLNIKDNELDTKIRILGFIKIGEDLNVNEMLSGKKEENSSGSDGTNSVSEEDSSGTVLFEDENGNQESTDEDQLNSLFEEAVEEDATRRKKKPTFFEFYKEKLNEWYVKINSFIHSIPDRIKEKWQAFREKYKDLKRKYKFFTSTRAKRAYKHALKQIFKLLKHLFPRKIKGDVHFGLPSPADTGTVFGIVSSLLPIRKDDLNLYPNFEEKEINVDVTVKGRIFIGRVLILVLVLLLNKDVIYMLKRAKKVLQ